MPPPEQCTRWRIRERLRSRSILEEQTSKSTQSMPGKEADAKRLDLANPNVAVASIHSLQGRLDTVFATPRIAKRIETRPPHSNCRQSIRNRVRLHAAREGVAKTRHVHRGRSATPRGQRKRREAPVSRSRFRRDVRSAVNPRTAVRQRVSWNRRNHSMQKAPRQETTDCARSNNVLATLPVLRYHSPPLP